MKFTCRALAGSVKWLGIYRETRIRIARDCFGSHPTRRYATAFDRSLATRFGAAAVRLAARGGFDRMVALQCGHITDITLVEATAIPKRVKLDDDTVITARNVGISFGDE